MDPMRTKYKIPQFSTRLVRERAVTYATPKVTEAASAALILHAMLDTADREKIVVIYLNGRLEPTGCEVVAVGGLHGVGTGPREIFRGAIIARAAAIILGHNHSSGDPTPSPQDVEFTRGICAAGKVVGIGVTDHMVVCSNGTHRSMFDMGLMGLTESAP